MSSYIEIRNVVKSFGNNTVLKHINLDVNEGEMVTLLGPSGCGKSTLLRAIAGLNDVDEGSVFIDGKDVTNVDVRQRQVGMVFQSYALFPQVATDYFKWRQAQKHRIDNTLYREENKVHPV